MYNSKHNYFLPKKFNRKCRTTYYFVGLFFNISCKNIFKNKLFLELDIFGTVSKINHLGSIFKSISENLYINDREHNKVDTYLATSIK